MGIRNKLFREGANLTVRLPFPTEAPRILVCRLSHIGDCVLTLPMVQELRRAWPEAHIVWAMESPAYKLLAGHPAVDEFLIVSRKWLKSLKGIREMRGRLREYRFDVAVDSQSLLKSAVVAGLSGAPSRLGFAGIHGREMTPWINNCRVTPRTTHLVDRSLELIRPLVPDACFRGFEFPIAAAAHEFTESFLEKSGIEGPLVAINPGAGWPSKRWEIDRFAAVARLLSSELNASVIVTWAGDDERAMAEEVVTLSLGTAILAPATSLVQLAAVCQRAAIFVGGDTGPLHIAAAAGTVCIGLYGPTRPTDSGAYGPDHFALQARYESGSSRHRRRASNDAMRAIEVPDVIAACRAALSRPAAPRRGEKGAA